MHATTELPFAAWGHLQRRVRPSSREPVDGLGSGKLVCAISRPTHASTRHTARFNEYNVGVPYAADVANA